MVRVRTFLAYFNRLFIVPKPNQKWRPILDLSALNYTGLQQHPFPHSHTQKFVEIPDIPFPEPDLCGQGSQVHGSGSGYKDPPVPRRLVDSSQKKSPATFGTQSLLALCHQLGWVVNLQKSELEPKQIFEFVGYQAQVSQADQEQMRVHSAEGVIPPDQPNLQGQTVQVPNRTPHINRKAGALGRLHMRSISGTSRTTGGCLNHWERMKNSNSKDFTPSPSVVDQGGKCPSRSTPTSFVTGQTVTQLTGQNLSISFTKCSLYKPFGEGGPRVCSPSGYHSIGPYSG